MTGSACLVLREVGVGELWGILCRGVELSSMSGFLVIFFFVPAIGLIIFVCAIFLEAIKHLVFEFGKTGLLSQQGFRSVPITHLLKPYFG